MKIFDIILIMIIFLLVGLFIIIGNFIYKKRLLIRKDTNIVQVINHFKDKDQKLKRINKFGFDYKLEDKNSIIYFCIVNNFDCEEICINNPTHWQIRPNDVNVKMKFFQGIDVPVLHEFNEDKYIEKIFIVYPNAKQIYMTINECEVAFVYPDTNVHGYKVISYEYLAQLKKSNIEFKFTK